MHNFVNLLKSTELYACKWYLSKFQGLVMDREAWHAAVHRCKELDTTEQLNWTEIVLKLDMFQWTLLSELYAVLIIS